MILEILMCIMCDSMKLSDNFTLEEMTRSGTAAAKNIDNTPNQEALENLSILCREVLQPIRDEWKDSIVVSSGYRCPKLNAAVKGAKNSQHIYGSAADIHTKEDTPKRNKELFDLILAMTKLGKIKYRQVIDEYGYNWIHIAIQDKQHSYQNNQVLHLK